MPYSAFKSLKSDGSIPASLLPCSSWVLQYNFEIDGSADSGGSITTSQVGADIEFLDTSGNVICAFKWTVAVQIYGDAFGAFWSIDLTGDDPGYPEQAGQYFTFSSPATVSTSPSLLNDGTDGNDLPASGTGYTVMTTMETPIVNVPLPAGTTVRVTFHSAGYPYTAALTDIQISTRIASSSIAGVRNPGDTEVLLLAPGASSSQQVRSVDRSGKLQAPTTLPWTSDGNIVILKEQAHSKASVIYEWAGNILLRTSNNDAGSYGDAVTIYKNYTLLGAVQYKGGTLVLMQDKSNKVYAGFGDRSGVWADPVAVTVPSGSTLAAGVLIGGGGQLDFYWSDSSGNIDHLSSRNDGITWA